MYHCALCFAFFVGIPACLGEDSCPGVSGPTCSSDAQVVPQARGMVQVSVLAGEQAMGKAAAEAAATSTALTKTVHAAALTQPLTEKKRCDKFRSRTKGLVEKKKLLCGSVGGGVDSFWDEVTNPPKDACDQDTCATECAAQKGAGCCQFIGAGAKHPFEEKIPNTCWFIQGSTQILPGSTMHYASAMSNPGEEEDEDGEDEDEEKKGDNEVEVERKLGDYWHSKFDEAGVSASDQAKVEPKDHQWFYNGGSTKVAQGRHDDPCSSSENGLYCAGGKKAVVGYGIHQAKAVKEAIDNGGVYPDAPEPAASTQPTTGNSWKDMGAGCCTGDRTTSKDGKLWAGRAIDLETCKSECLRAAQKHGADCGAVDYGWKTSHPKGSWCFVWSTANKCESTSGPDASACGSGGGHTGVHAYKLTATTDPQE